MCPSFMATLDERDSTRGRANALRLAMTGKLGLDGLADQRVADVLDLCLSCKACKAECPSLVDMARLKAEFTASYYDRHGTPLRARIFGNIHRLNRLGSLVPPLANFALRSQPGRWALERVGITPKRALPMLARQRFSVWARKHAPRSGDLDAPILISDTYTEYNFPHLGKAALRVAEAAGFRVEVWGPRELDCCGRPMISKGLLDGAKALAIKNVRRMAPVVAQGRRFMLIEPSCAAAFRDEYPDLVPAELREDARRVAEAVMTVEEWLAEIGEDKLPPERFDSQPRKVLLHGHCYQRALWGTTATHRALKLIPNCRVTELDDGCCGVAGSFVRKSITSYRCRSGSGCFRRCVRTPTRSSRRAACRAGSRCSTAQGAWRSTRSRSWRLLCATDKGGLCSELRTHRTFPGLARRWCEAWRWCCAPHGQCCSARR